MEWTERLNRSEGRVALRAGTVEVLYWAHEKHLADNRPHWHTFFEVCLVGRHGAGEFIVQDRRHSVGPGDVFVARPGVIHQIVNTGEPNMELRWVSFQWTPPEAPHSETDALLRAFADSSVLTAHSDAVAALWAALEAVAEASPNQAGEA